MKIAIIDADLIGRKKHRFPNLACMKLSGYYKNLGFTVDLKTDYLQLEKYDKVFISKVFTDTPIEEHILTLPNVTYGGTGFYYDKAPPLPSEIEHTRPDYHLYDDWVNAKLENGASRNDFKYYLDYSIGFLTRGCFRQCEFCVNKNYKKVSLHSSLSEFVDTARKKICLLDDNFFGCPSWKTLLSELQETGKPFQFKQGLDERLLTDEKCNLLFSSKYDGDYIFAFDNWNDAKLIESKLKLVRKYTNKNLKFYVFCGFDRSDKWDTDFWKRDLWELWWRIELLMKYQCVPYVMRYNRYVESPYRGTYINVASWCNQPNAFKKKSYREYVEYQQSRHIKECSETRYLKQIEGDIPKLAKEFFDIKFEDYKNYENTM